MEEDSIINESPTTVTLIAESLVRFSSNARVYLKWTAPPVTCTGYDVKYKLKGASSWTTTSNSTLEIILTGLQKDTNYLFEIVPAGNTNLSKYKLANGLFTTHPQTEPIKVSEKLYNNLMGWFASDEDRGTFCEYFGNIDVNPYEKLSFIQKYAFDNEDFVVGSSLTTISDWYPARYDTLNDGFCLPEFNTYCNCQVITKGTNKATPGFTNLDSLRIDPHIVQKIAKGGGDKTFIDRFEAGAAKYVALRQNEGAGGMVYEMTNQEDGDDATSVTTESSEIQFFLACLHRDEGGGGTITPIPDSCNCQRPLRVSYEYAANLYVAPQKKDCILISRGAGAQAEDLALVVAYNGKTGALTAIDAGKYALGRKCSTSWNINWWLNLLDVGKAASGYIINSLDTTLNALPTQAQIDSFISALQTLIGTPFVNSSGSCEEIETQQVLVTGVHNFTLIPNEPIIVALMSAYYVRTHGYGCYKSAAAVASDYYLMGVVQSEDTEDPECCSDKFADYIVGSLSYPPGGDVEIEAPNTTANRLSDVGCLLPTYGSWNGLVENPHNGCIILTNEFDLLRGPDCSIEGGFQQSPINQSPLAGQTIIVSPNVVKDEISLQLRLEDKSHTQISLFDMNGNLIRSFLTRDVEIGSHEFKFSLQSLPAGSYILNCRIGGEISNYPVLIVN